VWCREENPPWQNRLIDFARSGQAPGEAPFRFANPYRSTAVCRFFRPLTPSCSSSMRAFCGERS